MYHHGIWYPYAHLHIALDGELDVSILVKICAKQKKTIEPMRPSPAQSQLINTFALLLNYLVEKNGTLFLLNTSK